MLESSASIFHQTPFYMADRLYNPDWHGRKFFQCQAYKSLSENNFLVEYPTLISNEHCIQYLLPRQMSFGIWIITPALVFGSTFANN